MTHAQLSQNSSTQQAINETLLSPRFYRTRYKDFDELDISPVRAEWDAMMDAFRTDANRQHFREEVDFSESNIPPELEDEFKDFMVSSITAEYSGCVLYQEIRKNVQNKDIQDLMEFMARDESRHAGFINRSLKQLGVAVDLGFLKREKHYTYFAPKFIYYATYLSEKIGYARYITIFRHLQRHPEHRFHPIFKWFEEWCNDEFRHGEAFAMIMRSQPELLRGRNVLWIRFFLLAVYSTMYIRDHSRPQLYRALGMDPTEFDFKVFDITTAISRQIFPVTLDTDNPLFRSRLEHLLTLNRGIQEARRRGGLIGTIQRLGLSARSAITFAKLYLMPVGRNELPAAVSMEPVW